MGGRQEAKGAASLPVMVASPSSSSQRQAHPLCFATPLQHPALQCISAATPVIEELSGELSMPSFSAAVLCCIIRAATHLVEKLSQLVVNNVVQLQEQ